MKKNKFIVLRCFESLGAYCYLWEGAHYPPNTWWYARMCTLSQTWQTFSVAPSPWPRWVSYGDKWIMHLWISVTARFSSLGPYCNLWDGALKPQPPWKYPCMCLLHHIYQLWSCPLPPGYCGHCTEVSRNALGNSLILSLSSMWGRYNYHFRNQGVQFTPPWHFHADPRGSPETPVPPPPARHKGDMQIKMPFS